MKALGILIGAVTLIIVIGLIVSLPVMLLWNYCLVGAIAGVNEITWLQAWGILVLFGLLFKTHVTTKD
jgi:hypothetical protein